MLSGVASVVGRLFIFSALDRGLEERSRRAVQISLSLRISRPFPFILACKNYVFCYFFHCFFSFSILIFQYLSSPFATSPRLAKTQVTKRRPTRSRGWNRRAVPPEGGRGVVGRPPTHRPPTHLAERKEEHSLVTCPAFLTARLSFSLQTPSERKRENQVDGRSPRPWHVTVFPLPVLPPACPQFWITECRHELVPVTVCFPLSLVYLNPRRLFGLHCHGIRCSSLPIEPCL